MRKLILAAAIAAPIALTGCKAGFDLGSILEPILDAACKVLPSFFSDAAEAQKYALLCNISVQALLAIVPIIAPPVQDEADK